MPNEVTDPPPADVAAQVASYVDALNQVVPPKRNQNLLIGTWNIRAFNRLTPRWRSTTGDSPLRDLSNVLCIAETLRRFDVAAIQEVGPDPQALLATLQVLGGGWAYLLTDVVLGELGHSERLAFVFDQRRVQPSGLACELVVSPEEAGVSTDVLGRQFARTPYAVSFARGQSVFTLVTLHIYYGNVANDRVGELKKIAEWMAGWADGDDLWGQNLMALGDFNIDRQFDEHGNVDELYKAFTETGLRPPDNLNNVPRTIFDNPDPNAPADQRHFYDQIAWFTGVSGGPPPITLQYRNAGTFDFASGLVPAKDRNQLSFKLSDHYPLWVEFDV